MTFVPAKPGDYLTIYGVSFGAANPATAPGAAPAGAAQAPNATVTLGTTTMPAENAYVGVSCGTAGLYQVNIQAPAALSNGNHPLTLTIGSFTTPQGAFLTVQN